MINLVALLEDIPDIKGPTETAERTAYVRVLKSVSCIRYVLMEIPRSSGQSAPVSLLPPPELSSPAHGCVNHLTPIHYLHQHNCLANY